MIDTCILLYLKRKHLQRHWIEKPEYIIHGNELLKRTTLHLQKGCRYVGFFIVIITFHTFCTSLDTIFSVSLLQKAWWSSVRDFNTKDPDSWFYSLLKRGKRQTQVEILQLYTIIALSPLLAHLSRKRNELLWSPFVRLCVNVSHIFIFFSGITNQLFFLS